MGVHSTALVMISFLCLPVGFSGVLNHSFCFPLNDQYNLFFLQNSLLILVSYSVPLDPSTVPDLSKFSHWPKTELSGFLLHGNISIAHRKVPEGTFLVGKIINAEEPYQLKITTGLSKLSFCRALTSFLAGMKLGFCLCLCGISGWLRASKFLLHTAAPTSADWACVNTYHNYTVKTFLRESRAFKRLTVIWLWMYLQPKFKISIV